MAVHDRFARLTPYELALPDLEGARERFSHLAAGADPGELADPGRFLLSPGAARLLEELHGEAPPHLLAERGLLLFHAFHFWVAGERVYLLEAPLVRRLVEGSGLPPWTCEPAWPAGYLQLPQHLVWTEPGEGGAPESVDGLFWSAPRGTGDISLLVVAGMHPGRGGFSVLPLLPVPLAEGSDWPGMEVREAGGDFSSSLPGSELEGLHQVRTAGEVLKLAARAFAWLDTHPGREVRGEEGAGPPAPSVLPYRRIELD